MSAAIEDISFAIDNNPLATAVQESINILDSELCSELEYIESTEKSSDNGNNRIEQIAEDHDDHDEPQMGLTSSEDASNSLNIGDRVEILWPEDENFYTGTVASYSTDENKFTINYDDGDKETINMTNETWKFENSDVIVGNAVERTPRTDLKSTEKEATQQYFHHFKEKPFLRNHAEGLAQFVI